MRKALKVMIFITIMAAIAMGVMYYVHKDNLAPESQEEEDLFGVQESAEVYLYKVKRDLI
ncbi:MAG: hypothetical protein ACLFNR_00085 [Candidatus Paceibacterota bacterium]